VAGHGHCGNQNVPKLLTLVARRTRPDIGRNAGRFLIEGKNDAVGDKRLEGV